MNMTRINKNISYIKSSEEPLSADIGIVETPNGKWLFDVGNNPISISDLTDSYNIVLSHFHIDHTGNLDKLIEKDLYVSKETYRYTNRGTIVEKDIYIDNLHIFVIPSSHAKGCLGLEVDGEYAFVGDALYSKSKDGYRIYNVQKLKECIELLKELKANYLLVSHYEGLIRNKNDVIIELQEIYKLKEKNSPEIKISY